MPAQLAVFCPVTTGFLRRVSFSAAIGELLPLERRLLVCLQRQLAACHLDAHTQEVSRECKLIDRKWRVRVESCHRLVG